MNSSRRKFLLLGGGTVLSVLSSQAHDIVHRHHGHPPHVFTPHIRPMPSMGGVTVKSVTVNATVKRQVALTKMVIEMQNPSHVQQEGQALIPVPHGAVLKKYTLDGVGGKFSAKLMGREEARAIYDSIVRQLKDPALLEFAGDSVVKSSVFPVPARGSVKLEIQYEVLLPMDGSRIDYILPRTQSIDYKTPWNLTLDWFVEKGIASVYSPSHEVAVKHVNPNHVRVTSNRALQPGSFRLSVLKKEHKNAHATFYSYPDAVGDGGHFLMLMSPPARDKAAPEIKREVTVVIDKSGSMAGEKMDQVKNAALQVIEGLKDGEAFNVIVYNEAVEKFALSPVVKDARTTQQVRTYLKAIRVSGGTNINSALSAALTQPATEGYLPLVLFLTDGVPTIGETNEKKIRELVALRNPSKRRIFSFGVGVDVNTPLLNGISTTTRALASFVLPKENVELKVAQVFRRLSGPVLTNPTLGVVDADGKPIAGVIADLQPSDMADMYHQDQVVLLGRYTKKGTLQFKLKGESAGKIRQFKFSLDTKKASHSHSFVPRLWATRKIAVLIEGLRDLGAGARGEVNRLDRSNPRVKELIDEIIRLSLRYGVLTEYTAFLAREGAPIHLANEDELRRATADSIELRALNSRVGYSSVNQEYNINKGKASKCLNLHNDHWDAKMKKSQVTRVQQIGNKTYFRRGDSWGDVEQQKIENEQTVVIGSKEFTALVDELVKNNEQGCLSLKGNIRISLSGKNYLLKK